MYIININNEVTDASFECSDWVAADGMRVLGNPLEGDTKIVSGESGSITAGFLYKVMTSEKLSELRNELALDEGSSVLLINTEGNTDPEHYLNIVWKGWHAE